MSHPRQKMYYVGPDVSHVNARSRPSRIIHYYLRHEMKKKNGPEDYAAAVREFARATKIPPDRVRELANGILPNPVEMSRLQDAFDWGKCFLFGVRQDAFDKMEQRYFSGLDIESPTPEERKQFEQLHEKLLGIVYEDLEAGGSNDHE